MLYGREVKWQDKLAEHLKEYGYYYVGGWILLCGVLAVGIIMHNNGDDTEEIIERTGEVKRMSIERSAEGVEENEEPSSPFGENDAGLYSVPNQPARRCDIDIPMGLGMVPEYEPKPVKEIRSINEPGVSLRCLYVEGTRLFAIQSFGPALELHPEKWSREDRARLKIISAPGGKPSKEALIEYYKMHRPPADGE
jgi:hypothetical protein